MVGLRMQDRSVAFDPISIHRIISWQTKVFVLYLFAACFIWLVRSVKLFWQLGFFPGSAPKVHSKPASENDETLLIATLALANRLPEWIDNRRNTAPLLQLAGARFSFLWEACWIKISSMKRLAGLTFLSATLIFAWGATTSLSEISYSKITGIGALSGGFAELLTQFTLGVGVCMVLYVTSGFYEAALVKRQATWNYICAKANIGDIKSS